MCRACVARSIAAPLGPVRFPKLIKLEAYGVEGRVAWLELDLGAVLDGPHGNRTYTPVSKFPSSDIDLAFVVGDDVAASRIEASLRKGGKLIVVGMYGGELRFPLPFLPTTK